MDRESVEIFNRLWIETNEDPTAAAEAEAEEAEAEEADAGKEGLAEETFEETFDTTNLRSS